MPLSDALAQRYSKILFQIGLSMTILRNCLRFKLCLRMTPWIKILHWSLWEHLLEILVESLQRSLREDIVVSMCYRGILAIFFFRGPCGKILSRSWWHASSGPCTKFLKILKMTSIGGACEDFRVVFLVGGNWMKILQDALQKVLLWRSCETLVDVLVWGPGQQTKCCFLWQIKFWLLVATVPCVSFIDFLPPTLFGVSSRCTLTSSWFGAGGVPLPSWDDN